MVPTYGLLDRDGNPKPALNVFRSVAALGPLGIPIGAEPPPPGVPLPVSEEFTPSTGAFVVPFRQHIALEMARLEAQIKLLQDQVKQLQDRIGKLSDDENG
jgi:hypothetical protein